MWNLKLQTSEIAPRLGFCKTIYIQKIVILYMTRG